jgi:hypothetical protein
MRLIIFAAAATQIGLPACAETFGDWNAGGGQGVSEYWTKKTNGDGLQIDCGEKPYGPAADLRITVGGRDFNDGKTNRFIKFRAGGREGSPTYNEDGRLNTFCTACVSNYTFFWQALRSGKSVVFEAPDGRRAEFSLRGSTMALPEAKCVTEVELQMLSARAAREAAKKTVAAKPARNSVDANVAEKASGSCSIEDWKYADKADSIYLNGSTTCESVRWTP